MRGVEGKVDREGGLDGAPSGQTAARRCERQGGGKQAQYNYFFFEVLFIFILVIDTTTT